LLDLKRVITKIKPEKFKSKHYGKSHCCNGTFTDVQFTSLLAKNI